MSTITKERVTGIARGEKCYTHDDVVELARIALASLEAEPVAWTTGRYSQNAGCKFYGEEKRPEDEAPGVMAVYWDKNTFSEHAPSKEIADKWLDEAVEHTGAYPLYAAPPAPVSVNITRDQIREIFMRNGFTIKDDQTDLKDYVYAAAGELISFSRPQSPVSVPAAMEMDDDFDSAFEHGKAVGWNAYRAAMLQGADSELQRKAATHDALCEKYNVESLADFVDWQRNHIAELEAAPPAPVGKGETAVMPDYPGYVMTQRECYQAGKKAGMAEAGNSKVIPEGWVVVPVDMAPEMMRAVQVNSELGEYAAANLTGAYSLFREFWDVAIAAAPQQEVKHG